LRDAHDSAVFTFEVDRVLAGNGILDNLISRSSLQIDELKGMIAETNSSIDELTPKADILDYALAVSCGLLTGLIDIFLVGKPGESPLGDWTDKQFDRAIKRFAGFCGWNPSEGYEDSLDSAIRFLEKKFPINYDQIHGRSLRNHRFIPHSVILRKALRGRRIYLSRQRLSGYCDLAVPNAA
jgi:hypothetical protein